MYVLLCVGVARCVRRLGRERRTYTLLLGRYALCLTVRDQLSDIPATSQEIGLQLLSLSLVSESFKDHRCHFKTGSNGGQSAVVSREPPRG